MNQWQRQRQSSGWAGGYVEWTEGQVAYLSVVFSWQLQMAYQRAAWYKAQGYFVRAGGPAVACNPDVLSGVAIQSDSGSVKALRRHNPNATFTTRGCIRQCPFCAVPKVEGAFLRELTDEWEPRSLICDNNLLAASVEHFDHVIDRLQESGVQNIDFNQGLDVRLLTLHHAALLAELYNGGQLNRIRLAWDNIETEKQFRQGFEILRSAGVPARKIGVYVLIGFDDTPEDALYRLMTIWHDLKAWPNPMRYQPLDSKCKNEYVASAWTHRELQRYVRYWSNLRYLSAIPFGEFDK